MSALLARLTNHAKWPDGTFGGGIPVITADDIAAACNRLTKHVQYYARVKFCFDGSSVRALYRANREATLHAARIERWEALQLGNHVVERIADLALREALVGNLCSHCGGAGVHNNQKSCKVCHGSGKSKPVPIEAKARVAGVSVDEWKRHCERRYTQTVNDLLGFDSLIAEEIARGVYGS